MFEVEIHFEIDLILCQLLSGETPPKEGSVKRIKPPKDGLSVCKELEDVFWECVQTDPQRRPTAKELISKFAELKESL